jgi:predicted transglutaminase-like cysteine proteinase
MFVESRMSFLRKAASAMLVATGLVSGAATANAAFAVETGPLPVNWQDGARTVDIAAHFMPLFGEEVLVVEGLRGTETYSPDMMQTGAIPTPRPAVRPAPSSASSGLFGSVSISFRKLPAAARLRAIGGELANPLDCADRRCRERGQLIGNVVAEARDRRELISRVNRAVNGLISYRTDRDAYGAIDHWAGPAETLRRGYADCEDFALLKMAFLAANGVSEKDMTLVVLRDKGRKVYHSILVVRHGGENLVLDNLERDVRRDVDLPNYQPLYSVSAGKGFIHGWRTGGPAATASLGSLSAIAPGEGFASETVGAETALVDLR